MKKYLRIVAASGQYEVFKAIEYLASDFKRQDIPLSDNSVEWVSNALPAAELIDLLLCRKWHQTDIGDALHEARKVG